MAKKRRSNTKQRGKEKGIIDRSWKKMKSHSQGSNKKKKQNTTNWHTTE
jgi:hypothetical protein